MLEKKVYYYKLATNEETQDSCKFISGSIEKSELERIIFFLQARVCNSIDELLDIYYEDIAYLLCKYYGFAEHSSLNNYELILNSIIIKKHLDDFDSIISDYNLYDADVLNEILVLINQRYKDEFLFINTSLAYPEWICRKHTEPVSFNIMEMGFFINGLILLQPEDINSILNFFPKAEYYEGNLFFDKTHFPLDKYNFSWNGTQVVIKELVIIENEKFINKELRIGPYFDFAFLYLPITNIEELNILHRRLRVIPYI